jgi:F0F1-type ATP synthase assembly protein I
MEQKDITKKEYKKTYKFFIIMAMSTSILLISPVLLLGVFGYLLDKFFHSTPIFLIIGGIAGFISGIVNVFRMMQLMQERRSKVKNQNSKIQVKI